MLVKKLKEQFKENVPIFTNEILEIMKEYSRQRVYQMINEALNKETLIRYDRGIYYLPKETEFGNSILSLNDVINKKYIKNNGDVFGIYGKFVNDLNFSISTQVPNVIEVITNIETRKVREIEIRGRKIILRKSRIPITKENEGAYTLMELFNNINMRDFKENRQIKENVFNYTKEKEIKRDDLLNMAEFFPAKAMKNMVISGVLYEIT